MMHNIALLSRDPGATNQMIAVDWLLRNLGKIKSCRKAETLLFPLERRPVNLMPLSYSYGLGLWLQAERPAYDIESASLSPEKVLEEQRCEALISGMDDEDALRSRQYWRAARKLGLPIIFITDNDNNLALRSRDDCGEAFCPDLFLLTHGGKEELIKAGFPAAQIQEIPDLHRLRLQADAANYTSLRSRWGVTEGETVILFASVCFHEMSEFRDFPIDEIEVLNQLISSLEQKKMPDGSLVPKPRLVIRPHPREKEDKFIDYLDNDKLPVVVSRDGTSKDAILSADAIVGMPTALVDEARLLNKPVVPLVQ